jgi:hypothetical protein
MNHRILTPTLHGLLDYAPGVLAVVALSTTERDAVPVPEAD